MRFLTLLSTLVLMLPSIAVAAQAPTPYDSSTAPVATDLLHGISRTAPNEGRRDGDVFGDIAASIGASGIAGDWPPSARFEEEQRAIDRETIICTRCD